MNKFAKICLNSFDDTVIQNLKSGKTRKSGFIPMVRQEKLEDLFLVFLPDLKYHQKRFIRIPSLNVPEMWPFDTFSQFYQTVTMGTMSFRKIWTSVMAMYSQGL